MAALVHVGIGLATTRLARRMHVALLVLSACALDLIWNILAWVGIERYPSPGPWSHGFLMSAVWSAIAALMAWRISRSIRTAVIITLLVSSHWVVDFVTHPMTALVPGDPGLPILFDPSAGVGLGLYKSKLAVYTCESMALVGGTLIYLGTLRRLKQERAKL